MEMAKNTTDSIRKIEELEAQNQELKARLEEAEEALRAISTGEVDALVVYDNLGERIYTLQGADYAYRVMVESIHEGAANIKADGTILYGNKRLAEMLEMPLETVLGSSFLRYLSSKEQQSFSALIDKGLQSFSRAEFDLVGKRSNPMPVLITASATEVDGRRGVCLVVTDLTEQKLAMAREQELQVHLMEQREAERVRIARNLHDGPLQDVLALSYTIHSLIPQLGEAEQSSPIREIYENVVHLAGELRNVCNDLRPPNMLRFGLSKAIHYQTDELSSRHPNLTFQLDLTDDGHKIPKPVATTLFRIFQESMNNVIRHSQASIVTIRLMLNKESVLMEIQDNGIGFKLPGDWIELARHGHLGLVGMKERIDAADGKIQVNSAKGKGTTVQVEIPCESKKSRLSEDEN